MRIVIFPSYGMPHLTTRCFWSIWKATKTLLAFQGTGARKGSFSRTREEFWRSRLLYRSLLKQPG